MPRIDDVRATLEKVPPEDRMLEVLILLAERQDWMLAKMDLMLQSLANIERNTAPDPFKR